MGLVVGIAAVAIALVALYLWMRRRQQPRKRTGDGSLDSGSYYGDVYVRDAASPHGHHSAPGDGGDGSGDGGGGGE